MNVTMIDVLHLHLSLDLIDLLTKEGDFLVGYLRVLNGSISAFIYAYVLICGIYLCKIKL